MSETSTQPDIIAQALEIIHSGLSDIRHLQIVPAEKVVNHFLDLQQLLAGEVAVEEVVETVPQLS